jgi:hypothetical protein
MPIGPGKYDDACTAARVATAAEAVVLIVVDGCHGHGFSVQSVGMDRTASLPRLLRTIADEIEASFEPPA